MRKTPSLFSAMRGALLVAAIGGGLAGCQVEPWVKPYERDHLADVVMSFDRDPVSSACSISSP